MRSKPFFQHFSGKHFNLSKEDKPKNPDATMFRLFGMLLVSVECAPDISGLSGATKIFANEKDFLNEYIAFNKTQREGKTSTPSAVTCACLQHLCIVLFASFGIEKFLCITFEERKDLTENAFYRPMAALASRMDQNGPSVLRALGYDILLRRFLKKCSSKQLDKAIVKAPGIQSFWKQFLDLRDQVSELKRMVDPVSSGAIVQIEEFIDIETDRCLDLFDYLRLAPPPVKRKIAQIAEDQEDNNEDNDEDNEDAQDNAETAQKLNDEDKEKKKNVEEDNEDAEEDVQENDDEEDNEDAEEDVKENDDEENNQGDVSSAHNDTSDDDDVEFIPAHSAQGESDDGGGKPTPREKAAYESSDEEATFDG
jgi:hypothetical protein